MSSLTSPLLLALIAVVTSVSAVSSTNSGPSVAQQKKPNFVFILTDDQDITLGKAGYSNIGSLEIMRHTLSQIVRKGTSFSNFFVNTAICCPSRTEFFSGRYYHNLGAPNGSCMHVNAAQTVLDKSASMFGLLQSAGYKTGVFGKVTNDQGDYFCKKKMSDGMTYVSSPCDYNSFYSKEYFVKETFENSSEQVHIEKLRMEPSTYQTSQLGNRTLAWLSTIVDDVDADAYSPFFAYIGPHAPHYPATPAPWYSNKVMPTLGAPHTPNWGIASPEKPMHIRQNPPFNDEATVWMDYHMRDRWHSLLSVDDLVNSVVLYLDQKGVLDNTYIFYSSDHGYHLGQWRLGTSKEHPYETDIRVMLLARGPGIRMNAEISQIGGNVDLLPTMLDLAGIKIPPFIDGKSLAPFLVTEANPYYLPFSVNKREDLRIKWRQSFLIEYKSVGTYYNDHSSIWRPKAGDFAGQYGSGPFSASLNSSKDCTPERNVTGHGVCWFVDSVESNSWRGLRFINSTSKEDFVYVEYDPKWLFNQNSINFYEYYDLNTDIYQMHNLFNSLTQQKKIQLNHLLSEYFVCKGDAESPSNCP